MAKLVEKSAEGATADVYPIIVRCYSTIGKITGLGKITVEAQQIISSSLNTSNCSIRVEVETPGDYPTTGVSSIDYENIDRICATLEQLRGADPNATRFVFMEAICEVGDFKAVVFNTVDRRIYFSIQTHNAQVHMELAKLPQLIDLLRRGKSFIDQNKAVPSEG
ncbi:MAG TPA: hypothetical protein VFQ69_06825 [Rhizomicrobium sp.]|nr:hypothetical protein [Rhizomicrobium sp.]